MNRFIKRLMDRYIEGREQAREIQIDRERGTAREKERESEREMEIAQKKCKIEVERRYDIDKQIDKSWINSYINR